MTDEIKMQNPPAYIISPVPQMENQVSPRVRSWKSKALFGYAVAISTALIVVAVMSGVYYNRTLDILETAIKKFNSTDNSGTTPVKQNVEIDAAKNVVVYRMSGDGVPEGTYAVFDYTKSLSGIYDPKSQSCFLIPGIDKSMTSPTTLANTLGKNVTDPTTLQTLHYKQASSFPISDKSILPAPLQSACNILPVYWMEKTNATEQTRKKRWICWIRYCYWGWCYYYYYYC